MPFSAGSQNTDSLFAGAGKIKCQVATDPCYTQARQFLDLWREQSALGEIVVGRDIPSRPFATFLCHLMVAEPIDADTDCNIRVAGTLLHRYFGRDATGERLSDVYLRPLLEQHLAAMRDVRRTGSPVVLAGTIASELLPLRMFEEVIVRARAPDDIAIWNIIAIFVPPVS